MGNEAPPPALKMADRGRGRGNGACPRCDWSVRGGVTWAEESIRAPGRGAAEAPGSGRRGVSAASGRRLALPGSQRGRSGARAEHGGLPASLRGGLRHRVRAAGAHPAPARPRSSPGAEHLPAARPLSHLEALRPGPGSRPTAGQVRGGRPVSAPRSFPPRPRGPRAELAPLDAKRTEGRSRAGSPRLPPPLSALGRGLPGCQVSGRRLQTPLSSLAFCLSDGAPTFSRS